MVDKLVHLENNLRRLLRLQLALENYEDDTGENQQLLKEANLELKKFRETKQNLSSEEQINITDKIIEKYNQIIDIIGKDKFVFYDDGDINYIWRGENNELRKQ